MSEMTPDQFRRLSRLALLGLPLVVFAFDFVLLLVTYQALASIVPSLLGEVAAHPARFAAWVTLAQAPISIAAMLISSPRVRTALRGKGETSDPPAPPAPVGRRRILVSARDRAANVAGWAIAALIVFGWLTDPGVAPVWPLVALTAAGPLLLTTSVTTMLWPLRRWRRNRLRNRPPHAEPSPDQVGETPNPALPDGGSTPGR
ncbi:hypothetical protein [Actinoplanes sp. NPDC049118]|uniref:hypothetical protein n=1 Tax=Actinoplanes sp. NPDC049118 TaxID=3155769 RepID=UPI0033C6BF5F